MSGLAVPGQPVLGQPVLGQAMLGEAMLGEALAGPTVSGDAVPRDASPSDRVGRVLIDSTLPQLDHLFDYRIPEELAGSAAPGVRVRVPWRTAGQLTNGYLIEVGESAEFSGALSAIDSVVSPIPVVTGELWTLARRLADRAAGSANDILRLAVPARQVRVEKAYLAAKSDAGTAPDEVEARPAAALPDYPPELLEAVTGNRRVAVSAIPRLHRLPAGEWVGEWAITLATLARATLASGRSAILAVPDFRDQAQLQLALDEIVGREHVLAVDARQSGPDRYRAFLAGLSEEPLVILGNRSAVYAPASNLGLIALWDDSDPLFGEPLSPYVHARDAALVRQEQIGCALVFLAHSPSLEVGRLIEIGWLRALVPTKVFTPRVIVTANQSGDNSNPARIPSSAWTEARTALQSGPVLVQVARPGYAPMLSCQRCSAAARCLRCTGPLGLNSASGIPTCGWCGTLAAAWTCPVCESPKMRQSSLGAGRTAEDLGRAFPGVRVVVADGDRPMLTVDDSPALVIATRGAEPIPPHGYRAVLLLDGERSLARENLRVGDDVLRWFSNAAALAAPGAPVFLVGVTGPIATALATWRHDVYCQRELADRRALRFPPAIRVASLIGAAAAVDTALQRLADVEGVDVLGPVPVVADPTKRPGRTAARTPPDPTGRTVPDGTVRAIVRFDYATASVVAERLRAEVIRTAMARRKRPTDKGGYRSAPTLKVRFDDPEIL